MKSLLIALTLAAFGLAQGSQGPPPPAVVANFLGLSQTQSATFQQLLQALQTNVEPMAQQVAARQQALDQLLSSTQPDPTAVGRILIEIHALQPQIQRTVQTYRENFLGILNPDQKQKYQVVTQAATLVPAVAVFAASMLVDAPH